MNERNHMEFAERTKEGYQVLVNTSLWRFALLGWAPRFDESSPLQLERHMKTDEVFILLSGEATIIEGGAGDAPADVVCTKLRPLESCNLPAAVWHHIHVSRDGVVAIAENADTSKANTEYADWKGDVRYVDRGAD